jgi:hypothetical protein
MVGIRTMYEVTVYRGTPVKRTPWTLPFQEKSEAFWLARTVAKAFPSADVLLGDLQEDAMPDNVDHLEAVSGDVRIVIDRIRQEW